jgi:hypothetical protein
MLIIGFKKLLVNSQLKLNLLIVSRLSKFKRLIYSRLQSIWSCSISVKTAESPSYKYP